MADERATMRSLRRSVAARPLVRVGSRTHLRDESGIALLMALGFLVVLGVVVTTLLTYSGAVSRGSSLGASKLSARAIAEAGLNDALSVIATDDSQMKPQPQYAGDTNSTIEN